MIFPGSYLCDKIILSGLWWHQSHVYCDESPRRVFFDLVFIQMPVSHIRTGVHMGVVNGPNAR